MKLSDLIQQRAMFDQLRFPDVDRALSQSLDPLQHSFEESITAVEKHRAELELKYYNIRVALHEYDRSVAKAREHIQKLINEAEHEYLSMSYRIYADGAMQEYNGNMVLPSLNLDDQALAHIQGRITNHGDWKCSGLIIRPGQESWMKLMVALDPLYLVDVNYEYMRDTIDEYPPGYRRRLCHYVIKETVDHPLFVDLPSNQIGCCLAYNFFHYRPFELVRHYLIGIFDLLMPGGTLMMTINDGDLVNGVKNVENSCMVYTPGGLVKSFAESLGFEIHHEKSFDEATTWLELRKPGSRQSLRGGQVLGNVIYKPGVDINPDPEYNSEEARIILKQAIDLNIDTPENLRRKYSVRELLKLIKRRKKENARPST